MTCGAPRAAGRYRVQLRQAARPKRRPRGPAGLPGTPVKAAWRTAADFRGLQCPRVCGLSNRVPQGAPGVPGNLNCSAKAPVPSAWSLNLACEVCFWRRSVGARTGCVSHSVSKRQRCGARCGAACSVQLRRPPNSGGRGRWASVRMGSGAVK